MILILGKRAEAHWQVEVRRKALQGHRCSRHRGRRELMRGQACGRGMSLPQGYSLFELTVQMQQDGEEHTERYKRPSVSLEHRGCLEEEQ